ncbi:S8 family serine peptidase [Georgenia sp. MJ173]|uniref:S8 family serine peptidase n=1 Tax=Georgenia sunbinii TaxID=3117728 RepID=UPI002F2675B3
MGSAATDDRERRGRDFPEQIFAVASPVSVDGRSLFSPDLQVTAATIAELTCTEDAVRRAVVALEQAGFEVLQATSLMVNFAGPAELFEAAFGARLFTEERPVIKPGSVATTGTFIDTVGSMGSTTSGLIETAGTPFGEVLTGVAIEEPYYVDVVAAEPPNVDYWHLALPTELAAALKADLAHRSVTGDGVRVAMVDTGFQRHPFFAEHGYRVEPVVLGPGTADPDLDENGHGTGESANIFAAAPGVTLLPVKTAASSGALVNVTAAFNAAAALAPDIITNSWGSSQPTGPLSAANQALAAAVASTVASGVVVVFSAGNGSWGFPGQHPDVIAAGGAYLTLDGELRASDYASGFVSTIYPGRRVPDVCGLVGLLPHAMYLMLPVPAGSVIDEGNAGGSHPDGDETAPDDGWAAFSGTSAAAPQLAGVCALLMQTAPGLAPPRVRELLRASARDITTGSNHPEFGHEAVAGPDTATGHGLVDAYEAVVLAREEVSAVDEPAPGEPVTPVVDPADPAPHEQVLPERAPDEPSPAPVDVAEPVRAGAAPDDGGPPVVAIVMLRPATESHGPAPATAALLGQAPRAETVTDVAAALVRAGFRVGPPNGPTLAVEASAAVFAEFFGTAPVPARDGGWTTPAGDELPLDAAPVEVRGALTAVVLERPAELHRPDR